MRANRAQASDIETAVACYCRGRSRSGYTIPPTLCGGLATVGHTIQDKTRLLQRVRRLRGQVDAIERALEKDADCARVMQLTVSARGARERLHGPSTPFADSLPRLHPCR